ncbi:hypothetical protein [Paenibacillus puerhi]|uniref:hypothetical protein n=1 Tax=Paenibacillus puerhi TaxID=2692622 RepID=UPI00135ACD78|nr:hypothetical protein [Paenibacillus puerhi]
MRKVTLVFSFLFILVGILIRVMSNTIEVLMPKIGYAVFQLAHAGSFTPDTYQIDLSANHGWSTFCIFAGIAGVLSQIFESQLRSFIQKNMKKQ